MSIMDYNGVPLDAPGGRGRIYGSVLETMGNMPLVRAPKKEGLTGTLKRANELVAEIEREIILSFAERYLSTALFDGV